MIVAKSIVVLVGLVVALVLLPLLLHPRLPLLPPPIDPFQPHLPHSLALVQFAPPLGREVFYGFEPPGCLQDILEILR